MTATKSAPPGTDDTTPLSQAELDSLVEQYDPESNFRKLAGLTALLVTVVAVSLSSWHVYTAGFGLANEIAHRAIHLSAVLGLVFLVFPRQRRLDGPWEWITSLGFVAFYVLIAWGLAHSPNYQPEPGAHAAFVAVIACICALALPLRRLGGGSHRVPPRDWVFALFAAGFSLYLLVFFEEIFVRRVGTTSTLDLMIGVIAIAMVIEATRRTMGLFLPLLGVACVLYGMFGPYLPAGLAHRGYSVERIVRHLYIGTEGIYGIPVGVVATFVFHFVLFGIMAQMTGLGNLFINLATIVAGRFSGGPAKVSVVSSGLFGMISGSPIANTVTTGAMTIPLMKKVGFSPRFAGAVEASASCGGQVTPPIMGAAAFIMAETLGIPYSHLMLIAVIPAALHYVAILYMVHLEAKRLKLSGMNPRDIPSVGKVLLGSWHLFIPLVVMVTLLLMQYTPFLAAFWGIILTIACSWIPRLLGRGAVMDGMAMTPKRLVEGFEIGAKSALGIGAACACVGFVLGIATLTGVGFKFSAFVLDLSGSLAQAIHAVDVTGMLTLKETTIAFGLLFTAIACIIMGAGVPTTPTYIILAAIVAPALAQLGVPLVATHFFVFYFGVLADVTPPVALAAFAAAGIARSEPMRTGFTAFRLSMGKALVPFVFVFAPSLLFINFDWAEFSVALASAILAIAALGAAYTGQLVRPIGRVGFLALNVLAILMVLPNKPVSIVCGVLTLAMLAWYARPVRGAAPDGPARA